MGETRERGPVQGVASLQSASTSKRLELIASLRSRNIGQHIDLPQVIVCGDQSTGKSSVLEGLTEIPFPRQEGICTRFATQIIVEHTGDETRRIEASIVPHSSRSESERSELGQYKKVLESYNQLADTINEVGGLMGLREFGGNTNGPAFAFDILSIKVTGPTGMHLMVVDLPGIISTTSDVQTPEDKVMVHELVDHYMQNERTIILAVIQANNDVANQTIIQKARDFDPNGERTVGIITKPDLINEGSENRIAQLSKNLDTTKLKLGWFLLKNPNPIEMSKNPTFDQRRRIESNFFAEKSWEAVDLDKKRVGIMALREFVQQKLDQHIKQEIPHVREEIKTLKRQCQHEIAELGIERTNPTLIRIFLTGIANRAQSLILSGLNGSYMEPRSDFFVKNSRETRIRALVHMKNQEFADLMAATGSFRKVENENPGERKDMAGVYHVVTEKDMLKWVREIYETTRGLELSGTTNSVLLEELFHEQSRRWKAIAEFHVDAIYECVLEFTRRALRHITRDEDMFTVVIEETRSAFEKQKLSATSELEKLWNDELGHPITYNDYYREKVVRAREEALADLIPNTADDLEKPDIESVKRMPDVKRIQQHLLDHLRANIEVDVTEQACAEALTSLNAYYKVARKTWVDCVCRQVIERHLLRDLASVFGPERVAAYSDDELVRIAGERVETTERRKELAGMLENLGAALEDLRR